MSDTIINVLSEESLDIDSLKTAIQTDITSNTSITDIDYEGSTISALINVIAYLTYNINQTICLNANQTNLLTSTIRSNIISDARRLNYNITRNVSSTINVTIALDSETTSKTIAKWTEFTVGDYTFYNTSTIYLSSTNTEETVTLKEGTYIDSDDDSTLLFVAEDDVAESFTIGYQNIEDEGIFFSIKKSGESTYSDEFTKVETKLSLALGSDITNFYDEYEPDTGYVTCYTSFVNSGFEIEEGDTVKASILISNGADANGIASCTSDIEGITITVNSSSTGGTDEESDESIQANAPQFYNSFNLCKSADDYKSILVLNSLVEKANAWGGETIVPINLGYTYMSIIPQDTNTQYISSTDETTLLDYLSDKTIMATVRQFKHPNYFVIDIDILLYGEYSDLTTTQSDIEDDIETYFDTYQNKFEASFFQNKVTEVVSANFSSSTTNSATITTYPKLLLSSELFERDGTLQVYIPNSPSKYYLVKDDEKISVPDNDTDLYSYIANGWSKEIANDEDLTITFDGTINSKTFSVNTTAETTGYTDTDTDTEYEKYLMYLDTEEIGYYLPGLNRMDFTTDLTDDIDADTEDSVYINLTYSPGMNVILEKSSFITLGDISFI